MFPLPISFYIYAALSLAAIVGIGYGKYESNKYDAYKLEIATIAAKQKAKNIEIVKEQALINKGISNAYDAKLAAVRNYYANSLHNPGGSKLPGISATATIADARATYTILAGQCAETTEQLVSLQDWIKGQMGI